MRHSRSAEFQQAIDQVPRRARGGRWGDLGSDPNAPAALAMRAEVLRAAWRPPVADRVRFLQDRCRGHRVLDIGCVAHDTARMDSPQWLHGRLAAVAGECIGVDVLPGASAEMERRGYRVVVHDLTTGLGPLAREAPFDVIVAGELIEHVGSIDMLFEVAVALLVPGGQLILTTPNPYSPRRVRAAHLGIVWENVDHVLYAFPSGVAELAERHGLLLSEATTIAEPRPPARRWARSALRRLRGRQYAVVGFATSGPRRELPVRLGPWGRLLGTIRAADRFSGETFVYVVRRAPSSA